MENNGQSTVTTNPVASNVTEKYAVYSLGADGKDVLSVVVDTQDEAKKELEKLKSGTACVKINKSKVENFGKDGEKIIESVEVECWKKENEVAGDKLSSFQKTPEVAVVPPMVAGAGLNGGGSSTPTIAEPAKKTFKEKLEMFYGYFSTDGDLMGVGYGFFPTAKPEISGAELSSGNVGADGKPAVIIDEKEEIKKLTAEVAEMKEKLNELVSLEKGEDDGEEKEESGDGKDNDDDSKD
jgi:hypothetical protein